MTDEINVVANLLRVACDLSRRAEPSDGKETRMNIGKTTKYGREKFLVLAPK